MHRILEVSTAIGCPLGCDYCPQAVVARAYQGPRYLTPEVWGQCLAKLPTDVKVVFSGLAEPWSNPDCTTLLLQAAARGPVHVFTTLAGTTLADVERLRDVPLHLDIHLPDAAGRMRLEVTAEYLAVLQRCRERFAHNCGVIGTLHPAVRAALGQDLPPGGDGLLSRGGNLPDVGRRLWQPGPLQCSACRDLAHNVLLPDGRVLLCCMDYGLRHVLGNLRTQPYEALFRGPAFREVCARLASPDGDVLCRQCELAEPNQGAPMRTCIIDLAVDKWYPRGQRRLADTLAKQGYTGDLILHSSYPAGCPTHQEVPYGFKPHLIEAARQQGYEVVLWLDASMMAIRHPAPVFEHILVHGHLFEATWEDVSRQPWKLGQWSTDAFLVHHGVTRDEAMQIPLFSAGFTGLDLRRERSQEFLRQWLALSGDGISFHGPWYDKGADPRYQGHRHDMSAGALLAHRMGMEVTRPRFMDYAVAVPMATACFVCCGM